MDVGRENTSIGSEPELAIDRAIITHASSRKLRRRVEIVPEDGSSGTDES